MAVNRITSQQFRKMGVMLKTGEVVTLEEHLRRSFKPVFDAHADEFARIFSGRSVDWPFTEKDKK